MSYTELCARNTSLMTAQEKDTQWLNSLNKVEDSMEWNGFNNKLAMSNGVLKPVSTFMLCKHSGCICSTFDTVSLEWAKDIWLDRWLSCRCSPSSNWEALGRQFHPSNTSNPPVWTLRKRRWHILEAADVGTYDEVFLCCWSCPIRPVSISVSVGDERTRCCRS